MKAKIISVLMIATMLLGFAAILPKAFSTPFGGHLFVDPANNVFGPAPPVLHYGQMFTVNVTLENATEIMGVQFHLAWDPTLLNCTSMTEVLFHTVTPSSKWGNINMGLAFTYDNTAGTADYAVLYVNGALALSDLYAPVNVTTGIPAATFIFECIKEPPFASFVSCPLALSNVIVGDKDANDLGATVTSGLYQNNWSPPSGHPYFDVVPAAYTASNVGEVFNISVRVNNLDPGWAAVGFEFKLSYNATILQLLNVYEGPWLPPFGVAPNQGTLFMTAPGAGNILVGDVELPVRQRNVGSTASIWNQEYWRYFNSTLQCREFSRCALMPIDTV